jgi:hypothetical protein
MKKNDPKSGIQGMPFNEPEDERAQLDDCARRKLERVLSTWIRNARRATDFRN